jgi:hypothetical protein
MLLAMAVSLAGAGGQALLGEALRQAPALRQSSDIAAIDQALAEGGYDFAWWAVERWPGGSGKAVAGGAGEPHHCKMAASPGDPSAARRLAGVACQHEEKGDGDKPSRDL